MFSLLPVRSSPATSSGAAIPLATACSLRPVFLGGLHDGLVALVVGLVAQILIAGIQLGLDRENSNFPAPILAMTGVFILFAALEWTTQGVEDFYRRRLKGATELLNRHMSIGFTIPVVMLCRGPVSDARSIGMIMICFVLTGIFNTVAAYFLTLPIQCMMVRHDKSYWEDVNDNVEKGVEATTGRKRQETAGSLCEELSTGSSLTIGLDSSPGPGSPSEGEETDAVPLSVHSPSEQQRITALKTPLRAWALRNPVLVVCWILTLCVGLPLRYTLQNDIALATSLLFSTWLTTLALQSAVKSHPLLAPWLRTLLSGISNAVLWTSLVMIAYVFADSTISARPLPVMLDTLQTRTPLSTLIVRAASAGTPSVSATAANGTSSSPTHRSQQPGTLHVMAAGDVAVSILNSGLVAWGLKLYEHRARLLSRAGLAVCTASAALALGNVTCGPLFARVALGVSPPGRAVAFAARSVTIALADPAMAILGGDAGLNAAMVVGSGIAYQMALGFGIGSWLERRIARWVRGKWGLRAPAVRDREHRGGGGSESGVSCLQAQTRNGHRGDTETQAQAGARTPAAAAAVAARQRANDPLTVSAGVTVGVNAAAMGAAYLYEAQSEAAPHAALSMIALGVMTVVFSSIPPLARWVMDSALA